MVGLVDGNNFFVSCERVFNRHLVGRPVAVLSNNDGCCVAVSPEFKALGIPRGTPYYQLKDREAAKGKYDGLIFLSSNYELYGDMSRRLMAILREEAVGVEQYSVDEAFIVPPEKKAVGKGEGCGGESWLMEYGTALRRKIYRWIGIPCGVGFATTKTLAKIANHIAKKRPGGVFVMPEDPTEILSSLSVGEVWGVGRRLPQRLRGERIFTACDLRDARDEVLQTLGGITLLRTARELRGEPCSVERDYDADPDSVTCSRSFGEPVSTLEALAESIACFTAQAAAKLRRHGMLAAGCNIFAVFGEHEHLLASERTVTFPTLTDATNVMLSAVRPQLTSLFREGTRYRKSGVTLFGLESAVAPRQLELFQLADAQAGASQKNAGKSRALYQVMDSINCKYGKGSVGSVSEGLKSCPALWSVRRDKLTGVSTTKWGELPKVR